MQLSLCFEPRNGRSGQSCDVKAQLDLRYGPVRQPAADQRDCRPWPQLQGKAQ